MARRFSWCTVVALVVLLFVTTEGLRERSTQVDDHNTHNPRDRGTQRFNAKSLEDATTAPSLSPSRSKGDRSSQSNKSSYAERRNEGAAPKPAINSESKFGSSNRSNARTTKTTDRSGSSAVAEATNNSRRSFSGRNTGESERSEPTIGRRSGKSYSPEISEGRRAKDEQRKTFARRVDSSDVTERLDNRGPSVFSATTESSRSRTGRKIQTTYTRKDTKPQLSIRRHNNKKHADQGATTDSFKRAEGRSRPTTERVERSTRSSRSKASNRENNTISRKPQDTLLSESESVRVDIPLAVEATDNPVNDVTAGVTGFSQRQSSTETSRRSDGKDSSRPNARSKGRGRSSDTESNRNGSRRGSSRFNEYTTTEASEQTVGSRRSSASRDRSRGSASESRSRSRGRNLDSIVKPTTATFERDVKRKTSGDRNSPERRSRIAEANARTVEGRGQDQDARGRSRNRSRVDATTSAAIVPEVTTIAAPDTTAFVDVATTSTESEVTTVKPPPSTTITVTSRTVATTPRPSLATTVAPEGRNRRRGRGNQGGNQGRTEQKEDFFNHGLGFRGRKPLPEVSPYLTGTKKPVPSQNDSQSSGNPGWTLRRRPGHSNSSEAPLKAVIPTARDQTNEVIPPNEQSTSTETTTTVESSSATTRRGFKKLQTNTEESTTVASTTMKGFRRGNKTYDKNRTPGAGKVTEDNQDSDNYPPDFKARLSQLKSTNTKIPAPKTTSRTPLEVKRSSAALFAERSRMKLDLARRLVKPELNIEENDLDATTASSFSKPKPTSGKPSVDGTVKVAKFAKPAAAERRASIEHSREDERASNLSRPRKGLEDSFKVTRPSASKKVRVISERMVTSISIEERVEETTKPYGTTSPSVITVASEETAATTLDTARVRLSGPRAAKKSKEELHFRENTDPVTTVKPKKPYAHQPRNRKNHEQLRSSERFGSSEETSATSTKRTSKPTTQRTSQTSQEENVIKKSKFGNDVTKPSFRPRYSKKTKDNSIEDTTTKYQAAGTTKLPTPTSRYSRKKAVVKTVDGLKVTTTEGPATLTKKIEFRPRTATYRRHSEVPTTSVETTTKVDGAGVAITPRSTRFQANLATTSPAPRSVPQEPQVNLQIANDTTQQAPGITGSSNGDSGNTNVFNPARSAVLAGNATLLEQLRSTVAPLLSSLGNKTPVFSGSYSNVNNANSAPRITPSGSPPRFSARYKGAELFIRKQNNVYQATVPSITSSSTTPVTPVENSGAAPPIDVSSPGEPRFLTIYQALESANIRNERLLGNASLLGEERTGVVPQVDSNVTVANGTSNNSNNDTTSPTMSPQTPDTTTIQDSTLNPQLSEETENSTSVVNTGAPENPSTEISAPVVTTGAPENPPATEQASTSTEQPSTTEQASTSTVSSTSTEQVLTSTESSSSTTEQVTTTTVPSSTTEQPSTTTASTSTPEQTSTTTGSTSTTPEQTSTTTGSTSTTPEQQASTESLPSNTDTTTTSTEPPLGFRVFERIDNSRTTETTTVSATQSLESLSTVVTTEVPAATSTTPGTSSSDLYGRVPQTTVATSTAGDSASTDTTENLESNTIQLSEDTSTQAADVGSTAATTTEAESSNVIDGETTTESAIAVTTLRSRLIDFAQDILSRLQASLNTTTVPSQDATTTIAPETELSNVISDSNRKSTLEVLAQLNSETTTARGDLGTTTTSSSVTMDQPGPTTTEGMTTESAVGSVSTTLPTTATDQEDDTQDELNSATSTTAPPTTQDSQTVSNTDSNILDDSNNSSNPAVNPEVTTASMPTATNDTLLTELMFIAKSLLSEGRNDTEGSVENNASSLTNDVSATTQAAESSSSPPDVTTEPVESTSTVDTSELTTSSVDPSQNEVDSVDSTTTGSTSDTPTETPRGDALDNEVDVAQTNRTTSLGPLAEIVESTTPAVTTEIGPRSDNVADNDTGLDTTTQSQTTDNIELTTNANNLASSNPITTTETQTSSEQATEVVTESTETALRSTNPTTVTSQPAIGTGTNQSEITATPTVPETTPSSVNMVASTPSVTSESNVERTTVVPDTELIENVTSNVDVETNQRLDVATELASVTTDAIGNDTSEATTPTVATTAPLDVNSTEAEATANQSPLTTTSLPTMEITTNTPGDTTTIPQTSPNPENETPTVVAPFQDTTSTTAQGTAGSGIGQTTEITTPSITPSTVPPTFSTPDSSSLMTTASSSTTVETTTGTTATTATVTTSSTGQLPDGRTTDVVTVTPVSETTAPMPTSTTVDINENLVSTEATTPATTVSPANQSASNAPAGGTTTMPTPGMTTPPRPRIGQIAQAPTTPYLGRFGGSRLTPAPRFSPSSTTRAPLRDYLIYGIYPNKTIVRKRPEDNLIDARNVDSPYVIFGIFPDGRLVRKFPNGTIIPDPPRNPVEVVFSLSTTTTTNRPPPRPYYNQVNQGTYNQYQGPGTVDLGLSGNAIVGPNGGGPGFTGPLGTPASAPSTDEMSNTRFNTQMGTPSSAMSGIGGPLTPIVSTGRPPTDSQGGRIVQDRERDEATRTKEAGGQRSSVYIGQDKFVNYWTDGAPAANPRVVSVNINSVASAANEGPSTSVPSFENLLNNQPTGQVTAPPGFPWRDPLDQIFGITTASPVITASVASNTLDDSADANGQFPPQPINPFVEVFTPFSSLIGNSVSSTQPSANIAAATTMPPTGTTTTTTTTAPTTTTMAPTTTTTTTTTTTPRPATAAPASPSPATSPSSQSNNALTNTQQQNAFGTTFNDLAFLNSLLQGASRSSTPKTLTEVEQLLANKILSLALNKPGPTRSSKAINLDSASPNTIVQSTPRSPYEPIVIDLSPSSTSAGPAWQQTTTQTTENPAKNSVVPEQATWTPSSTTTTKRTVESSTAASTTSRSTLISTTKAPVVSTTKTITTPRPRTTTQAPLGFGASLWQALFGGGLFAQPTTPKPVKQKQAKVTTKSVNITPKPVQTTQKPETTKSVPTTTTFRSVDISKIEVNTPSSVARNTISATTPGSISTTKLELLNNPNPRLPNVAMSTISPEDDTKFLLALLRAAQQENKASVPKTSSGLSQDDESFLRAILSGRALTTTTPAPSNEINNAALLAALLKAQGIEPQTPATNIREQLLLASLGQSVTSAPTASPGTESTTITTRPPSTATRPTDTTKKTVTPRPTSGPRIRTTTWSPSSTYPPPLFSSFSNYGSPGQSLGGENSGTGALFGATRAFSQFLGAALSGAAQQLQSLVRNGTRIMSGAVG